MTLGLRGSNWEALVVHLVSWARGPRPHTTLVRFEISILGPGHD